MEGDFFHRDLLYPLLQADGTPVPGAFIARSARWRLGSDTRGLPDFITDPTIRVGEGVWRPWPGMPGNTRPGMGAVAEVNASTKGPGASLRTRENRAPRAPRRRTLLSGEAAT